MRTHTHTHTHTQQKVFAVNSGISDVMLPFNKTADIKLHDGVEVHAHTHTHTHTLTHSKRCLQWQQGLQFLADLMRQLCGVIRDDGKVVEGVQEPDTPRQLIRVGPKGQGDVAPAHRQRAAVHQHQTQLVTAIHNHSIACTQQRGMVSAPT